MYSRSLFFSEKREPEKPLATASWSISYRLPSFRSLCS